MKGISSKYIEYLDKEYKSIVNLNPGVDCIVYGKEDKRIYFYHPNTSNEEIFEKFQGETFSITHPFSNL